MSGNSRAKRVSPAYPTRTALMAEPGVLQRNVPAGWKRMVAGGGVAAVFTVAGLTAMPAGCTRDTSGPAAIVAPIFEHGDGRAAEGCVVVLPPVFISEEDARKIIKEELGKVGVKLTQQDVEMKEVTIRSKRKENVTAEGKTEVAERLGEARPLVADLVDPTMHVAVEFISAKDFNELTEAREAFIVKSYDFKKVGEDLAEQINAAKSGNRFGIFYDPAGYGEGEGDHEERKAAAETGAKVARENLRLQVRDFAEWLKKQGVI